MTEVIIENAVQIVATLLITLIGVLGAWLTAKIGKREELKNICRHGGSHESGREDRPRIAADYRRRAEEGQRRWQTEQG